MKQIACAQLGGPETCLTNFTGSTAEEILAGGMKHIESEHPEVATKMTAMSKEDAQQLMTKFQKTYNDTPEI